MKLFQKNQHPDHGKPSAGRRDFLQKVGIGSILASVAGLGYQSLRSLLPNVLYEPPMKFKIGLPSQLSEGVTFIEEKQLYVFKEGKSFYSISASCTHLGCTVKHTKLNQPKEVEINGEKKQMTSEFHCPCHGSKYYADGTNYSGPAPRPLKWYKLEVSPDDGQLIADLGKEVEQNYRLTV
ncbi:MAG: QcrA and Rieske domain-containing protein [Bacteroidota bacterium]